ncbi:hypothetical protein AB0D49_41735, partial [Streptomyces sp. NPDC048290]|uniref:hypothetical protein n=1 Tax=Streptomyces sp. NPDC048290 TaxID=3155811 RepID=UPI00342871A0
FFKPENFISKTAQMRRGETRIRDLEYVRNSGTRKGDVGIYMRVSVPKDAQGAFQNWFHSPYTQSMTGGTTISYSLESANSVKYQAGFEQYFPVPSHVVTAVNPSQTYSYTETGTKGDAQNIAGSITRSYEAGLTPGVITALDVDFFIVAEGKHTGPRGSKEPTHVTKQVTAKGAFNAWMTLAQARRYQIIPNSDLGLGNPMASGRKPTPGSEVTFHSSAPTDGVPPLSFPTYGLNTSGMLTELIDTATVKDPKFAQELATVLTPEPSKVSQDGNEKPKDRLSLLRSEPDQEHLLTPEHEVAQQPLGNEPSTTVTSAAQQKLTGNLFPTWLGDDQLNNYQRAQRLLGDDETKAMFQSIFEQNMRVVVRKANVMVGSVSASLTLKAIRTDEDAALSGIIPRNGSKTSHQLAPGVKDTATKDLTKTTAVGGTVVVATGSVLTPPVNVTGAGTGTRTRDDKTTRTEELNVSATRQLTVTGSQAQFRAPVKLVLSLEAQGQTIAEVKRTVYANWRQPAETLHTTPPTPSA